MRENCLLCGLAPFVPILNCYAVIKIRGLIREKKDIDGSCLNDLIFWWCCGMCALIQEAQEVDWSNEGQLMGLLYQGTHPTTPPENKII